MRIKRLGDAILFLGREDHREAWQASTVEDLSRVLDRYVLDCARGKSGTRSSRVNEPIVDGARPPSVHVVYFNLYCPYLEGFGIRFQLFCHPNGHLVDSCAKPGRLRIKQQHALFDVLRGRRENIII